jgi:hypothetical protein
MRSRGPARPSEPYGPPALDRLAALVGETQATDRLAPVTVVVPTNYVGVATRRALARRAGLAGVSFLTVYRLAELLGSARLAPAPAGGGGVRRSWPGPCARPREVPGCFEAVRERPATEEALVAHRGCATPRRRPRPSAGVRRATDVVRIHRHHRPARRSVVRRGRPPGRGHRAVRRAGPSPPSAPWSSTSLSGCRSPPAPS